MNRKLMRAWVAMIWLAAAGLGFGDQSLEAAYDFGEGEGTVARDTSGRGEPLDLVIGNVGKVAWGDGFLELKKDAKVRTEGPARRLSEAVKRSGELTIEAWIEPAGTQADGPARIVTLSADTTNRNLTLGQEGDRFDARLRSGATNFNGMPGLASNPGALRDEKLHVVFARERSGRTRLHVDGDQVAEGKAEGDLGRWDAGYRLGIGAELNDGRDWEGKIYGLRIYSRALSGGEIVDHAKAGPTALAERIEELAKARHFERKVAPILARHCLECHDPAVKEGKLDLSQRQTAKEGGVEGLAFVPGKPDESLLWELVSHDEMPEKRTPLTVDEKEVLRQWIEDGAVWTLEMIDPADYRHDGGSEVAWVRRLTVPEYIATVRDTLGVDISAEAAELLPPDVRADGFRNTAYNLTVDLGHVEAYARLAGLAVARMDAVAFAQRFSKGRKFTDDDMRALVEKMGRWVLRGPLDDEEIAAWRGITSAVAGAGGTYEEAVTLLLEGLLQSPRFLYRMEGQRSSTVQDDELATRLSYMLWGTSPDEELRRAATENKLRTKDQVLAQAERLLADERALDRARSFVREWLNLDRLRNLSPNADHFPDWKPELAADMQRETVAFFEEVAWRQERPLADLLDAPVGFLSPALARHYGLEVEGEGWRKVDYSDEPSRGGLLTQGSVLTIGGDEASMVTRGLFVLHELLRGVVNDPPPCVDTTPVASSPGRTQRHAAQERIDDPNCGACHSRFEPLAYGLEKYDGLGTFRHRDAHGNELREDGELLVPGEAEPVEFATAAELMKLMAGSDRVAESLNRKVVQYALGRPLGSRDVPEMRRVHARAIEDGGSYAAVMRALVTSDLVLKNRIETQP